MEPLLEPQLLFNVVKDYEGRYHQNAENGDVFIVQRDRKIHDAGVYADGQIIRSTNTFFQGTVVSKVNVDEFTGGNRFAVYRKNAGIPQSFKDNVAEALSRCPESNFSKYNCIELAMELLEVNLELTESDVWNIASGSKPKGFKVVKKFSDDYNGNAMQGDLFLVQSGILGFGYYHAGVCCRENGPEIIQFTSHSDWLPWVSTAGASVSTSCPGLVNKVHINGFTRGRKYAIYRRNMGIPDSFQGKVDEAMSKDPKYKLPKYNCVHFALELLYGKLKESENNVEDSAELFFGRRR